ncbi:hypothetical protein [Proteiniphilum sp. X52]|uniref:hypothetical protein n=1 Tax=Proteiniphilum sp. X52 TaxID=2382159 RepID=UPI001C8721D2|nr:hypothetical protein [Proteiniphilum sp. X52]
MNEINNLKSYLLRSLRNRLIDINRTNKEDTTPLTAQEEMRDVLPFQLHVTVEDELILKEDAEEITIHNLSDYL